MNTINLIKESLLFLCKGSLFTSLENVKANLVNMGIKGVKVKSESCPIARAISKLINKTKISVTKEYVRCEKDLFYFRDLKEDPYVFPQFIIDFDAGIYPELIDDTESLNTCCND